MKTNKPKSKSELLTPSPSPTLYTHTSVCVLPYRSASSIALRFFTEIFSVRARGTSK